MTEKELLTLHAFANWNHYWLDDWKVEEICPLVKELLSQYDIDRQERDEARDNYATIMNDYSAVIDQKNEAIRQRDEARKQSQDTIEILEYQKAEQRIRAETAERERDEAKMERNDALRRYSELAEEAKNDVRQATEAMVQAERERDKARREVERLRELLSNVDIGKRYQKDQEWADAHPYLDKD